MKFHHQTILHCLVVMISACHADGPGSIPGEGDFFFFFFFFCFVLFVVVVIFFDNTRSLNCTIGWVLFAIFHEFRALDMMKDCHMTGVQICIHAEHTVKW
jgi:hypothetical protein